MAVGSGQVSVAAGTVVIASADAEDRTGMQYRITNQGAGTVVLGGASVAGTTGYYLTPAATVNGTLTRGEAIYGCALAGTVAVHVLATGI